MGATEDTRIRGWCSEAACGGARGCRAESGAESGALLVVLSNGGTKQSKQAGSMVDGCGSGCKVSLLQPQLGGVEEEED
jgi:hypothetical protein